MRICVFLFLSLAFAATSHGSRLQQKDVSTLPHQQVEQKLNDSHPSSFYLYATRLFGEEAKEDAVFWFYVGELRYRFYLTVNPKLPPEGDPALFESLHEVVGTEVNGWAGSNPEVWAKEMQRALDWDAANKNGFTSTFWHSKQWHETRSGLEKLQKYVLSNKAKILEDRKKNGL